MMQISVSEMVSKGKKLTSFDQETLKQFYINNQIAQMSHIIMASLMNSSNELQQIKEIQLSKKLAEELRITKHKLEHEFMHMRTD